MNPSTSVLIPCFNADNWIAVAIESALKQSAKPIEVIVCDDGSTDDSVRVVREFGDDVTLIQGEHRGGNATRNALLQSARGEWVQFLDADDYLEPDKLATQLKSLHRVADAADVIYSPVICEVWRNGRAIERSTSVVTESTSIHEQWVRWQVAQTGSVLWRKDALLSIGGWNEQYPCCQDNEVTLRAIQAGLKFHLCPEAGAVYRIWSEETVCRKDPTKVIRHKTQLIEQMMQWLTAEKLITPEIEAAAGQVFFEMARTWAKYDLDAATSYQRECRTRGWYLPIGPAAPPAYRTLHKLAGFRWAEKVTAWCR